MDWSEIKFKWERRLSRLYVSLLRGVIYFFIGIRLGFLFFRRVWRVVKWEMKKGSRAQEPDHNTYGWADTY